MQINPIILFISCILLLNQPARSQGCTVAIDSLKGKYTGDCKNGKADGQGKAEGVDTYEGEFKAGLPHGTGKYTWKNGNSYTGNWQKGNREGKGVMAYKISDQKDSIIDGYWKKDKYIGAYERPYRVITRTVHVTSVSLKKISDKTGWIDIFLDSETGKQFTDYSGNPAPAPVITDITVQTGSYMKLTQNPNLGKKIAYSLEDVTFPFKATFTIGNDAFEVEIFETGKWVIDLRMSF